MINNLKLKLITLTEAVHRRVFGHEMSDEMRKFLKNLSWSFNTNFYLNKDKIDVKIYKY